MNTPSSSYFAVVPAAGSGQRFGGELPKQYLQLLGRPVLRYTMDTLHSLDWLDTIVLVHAFDDSHITSELLEGLERVTTCIGGTSRSESVLNGLLKLPAKDDDWVLVHDAVRPCTTHEDVNRLKNSLGADDQAGILALPVRDTLKQVKNGLICGTQDREGLWQALTPQQARYGLLRAALTANTSNPEITDEASALEASGVTVRVVPGRPDNIKITYPEDLELASSILMNRSS